MRDARFGQFADPNFGASLTTPQPSQGVLPAPEASTSASSDQSNGTNTFGMPGLMGQNRGGSVYLAEGGEVPDETQDSGDAQSTQADPFSLIKSALAVGRKQYGLPSTFFGGQDRPDPMETAQNFAEGGVVEGEEPEQEQGMIPDPDQEQAGGEQPDQGGVLPDGNNAGGGDTQQGAMAYLSGHGAVGPEIAAALEQQVDPQGQMDPSLRKMLAVNAAGDPNKAFGLMQHYRQKFNALGAFAKAALTGAGGRPPNPAAAADALNQAYDHIPDGKALHFRPHAGGMQVTVHDVMPGKGQSQPQQEDDTQSFAEGGVVEDDFNYQTAGSETPSGSDYDRSQQASAAQAEPDDSGEDWETRKKRRAESIKGFGDKVGEALSPTEGEAEGYRQIGGAIARGAKALNDTQDYSAITNNRVLNWVLSIPQLLGWQSKDGQFDSVVEKGADKTLAMAAKMGQPPQESEGSIGPNQVADQSGAAPGPGLDINSAYAQGVRSDREARDADFQQRQAEGGGAPGAKSTASNISPNGDPEKVGQQVGAQAKEEGLTIRDALHQIDIAYGNWAGQQQTKALAKAAVIKEYAIEKVKGENALERAKVTGTYGVQRAEVGAAGGLAKTNAKGEYDLKKGENHETHADGRNANSVAGKGDIAQTTRAPTHDRFNAREKNLNDRAIIPNKPSVLGSADKMNEARKSMGPAAQVGGQQQPQEQPQGTGQMKLVKGKWYKRGPNGEAIQVQGPTQ